MPDCEYGSHCTRSRCPFKHPPTSSEVRNISCCWNRRRSVYSINRDFVLMVKSVNISNNELFSLIFRHIRYGEGDLPLLIDISCRDYENNINPKVSHLFRFESRRKQCSTQVLTVTSVLRTKRQENVNMVKTVYLVTRFWICEVSSYPLNHIAAAISLCNDIDLKLPSHYNARYSYFIPIDSLCLFLLLLPLYQPAGHLYHDRWICCSFGACGCDQCCLRQIQQSCVFLY